MEHPDPLIPPSTVRQILDVNLDRAREGLRVIEEWCRFGLNNPTLVCECKALRQTLGQWHDQSLRLARNTQEDPGTALTHPQEQQRADLTHLLAVNFSRVQEALRVLEEYGKLNDWPFWPQCKQLRYRLYILESQLMNRDRLIRLANARLYLVTSPSETLLATVEAALEGGLQLVQYREKEAPDCDRLQIAQQLCRLCHQYNALFILNDRVDLALAVEADGVHLGQQDIPVALARRILGPERLVGRSTTNPQELEKAIQEGVDYIGVGPVYATPTKPGKTAAGLDYVAHAARHAPMLWYAIGGIDTTNLAAVMTAGGQRAAVVRAIMDAADPKSVTQALNAQLVSPSHDDTPRTVY
jgi:thiamine-phosphate pyrophosphorylase